MKKNTAGQIIGAQMVSATDGSAFTGAVTCYVCGDGGTQAAGSVGSGACTHEGNGYHTYAPAQAETNYDLVAFTFTGTGAIPATVQVFTGYPQTGDSYARLGAPAGASVSADIADVPTVAEFEARTLPSADYTVVSDLPSVPSAADNATAAAAAILATPANKLATDASGRVTPDAVTPVTDVSALALEATAQAILTDTGTTGVVLADKTGFKLAADGLDSITATEPTGKPTTFAGWVMWLVQRFRRADMTTTTLTVKTEAGATVTQQTVSDDGTTQSIGAPS